ncbi:PIR protein CIR protein [Plasmodium vinckei vinckei]|uniref:PIR protein CIR protein n=1 Tax=Plasmodium vinckei vinckei TaxID=54757 RepID=A0A449BRX6_PLAVN|nr:PIR protein CIR protein [Plasmodium vinckei vinckei]VEV56194.1 PIR protein CIR protein [Plasmodium vinckei vinckei]
MDIKSCDTFREIDNLFIDYENNEDKFNTSYGPYNNYCPVKNGGRKCETNYEKLSAITRHAYKELMENNQVDLESENELSADFLIMGLSNRLYKISKDHTLSLKNAFGKYLGNSIGNFNYLSILYNKKYYMGYNIGVMNGFYLLFKEICKTISISENPNAQQYEYIHNATQCYLMYDELYNFVNQCDPYHHLLVHLKTIYNDLIDAVIKLNNNDESLRSNLKKFSSIDKTNFEYEFSSAECKKLNKKLAKTTPKIIKLGIQMLKDDEKRKNGEGSQSTGDEDEDEDDDDLDLDEEDDDLYLDLDDDDAEDSDDFENTPQGTASVPDNGGDTTGNKDKVVDGTQSQENTKGSEQTDTGGDTGNKANLQSDSSIHTPTSGKNQEGGSRDGLDDGPKASGDQDATKSSGGFNGYLSNLWRTRLNPMNYIPSVPDIYETSKNILENVNNQVSNAYNSAMTIAKDTYDSAVTAVKNTYDTTMTTVKGVYSATTNYIGGTVSSITNQLSLLGSFSQLGDDKSGSGSSGNDFPTGNTPLSTTQIPKSDSNPPSVNTPSISSFPPDTPTNTQTIIPQPQSVPTQNSSQITDQNSAFNQVQIHDTNPGTGIPKTLTNSSTDPSTQGNGVKTGTVVKTNETPSIWCIGPNKKYDTMSIIIIFISTFIILAIMYKYISFGSAKNSKKKKSMKRVIKYGDGTRKTQIIIKSYDRNKDLKPIINSVDRKKYPLLNIYKLMQADPIPFINLFFLLIFFVYKRKLNYLEL